MCAFCMLAVVLAGMCMTSCSDDDDDGNGGKSTSLLIGSWYEEYYDGEYDVERTLTFKSDGTGSDKRIYYYKDSGRVADRYNNSFTYDYNATTKILKLHYPDWTYEFKVTTLTKDKLELRWADGSGIHATFERL